jgi:hypothetical protein
MPIVVTTINNNVGKSEGFHGKAPPLPRFCCRCKLPPSSSFPFSLHVIVCKAQRAVAQRHTNVALGQGNGPEARAKEKPGPLLTRRRVSAQCKQNINKQND